jgi:hypothetical protein
LTDAENPTTVRLRVGSGLADKRFELGPHSRAIDRGAVGGIIDGRSREGRFLRTYERALVEHVGGRPSVTQRCIIQRAARLALHLELMDERSLAGDHVFTTHDHLHYVSWSNALARLLARLGLDRADAKPEIDTLDRLYGKDAADTLRPARNGL